MLSYLWEIFVCFIETLLVVYLLYKKIGLRSNQRWRVVISIIFLTGISGILSILNIYATYRMAVMLAACILVGIWAFNFVSKMNWYRVVLWPSLFFLIVTVADSISFSIADVMVDYPLEELMTSGSVRVQFTLIYLLLVTVMVLALTHLSEPNPDFPWPVTLILFALLTIGIFAAESIIDISFVLKQNPAVANDAGPLTALGYILIVMLIALLVTFEWLGVIIKKNRELKQQNQLSQIEQHQYELMVSATESLAEWKHDYQGQLRLISALVEQERFSELRQFSENLDSALPVSACLLYSGNTTMDAVVSLRMMDAKRHSIHFETQLFLPERVPLNDVTFASLIGNVLDNALEACHKVPPETAEIHFEIRPWKQMMYIYCSNTSDGVYKRGGQGNLLSTKQKAGHGIGIRRIQEIVEQSGGTCQFKAEDDKFNVSIMIPLEESQT